MTSYPADRFVPTHSYGHAHVNLRFILLIVIVLAGCAIAAWRIGLINNDDSSAGIATPAARPDSRTGQPQFAIKETRTVEDFPDELVQYETVFWESADTASLRALIRNTDLVRDKSILEIGTGTGLISLCCLRAGARRVVATDVNPAAIANAQHNAERFGVADRLETRLVPLENCTAYSVIEPHERFDLIIANPPWENASPQTIDEYAFYDHDFSLLRSLLKDLRHHLTDDGQALLAYGCVDAIRTIQQLAPRYDLNVKILDDRNLDDLPQNFLPGMLLEITIP